jgi:hypothetical protein
MKTNPNKNKIAANDSITYNSVMLTTDQYVGLYKWYSFDFFFGGGMRSIRIVNEI